MEDDLIEIIESKHGLIEESESRVEQLFGVNVDVKKTNGGKWLCEVSPKSSCSSDGLVKAKIYIHSLLGDGEDFSTLVVPYDSRLQTMILKNRDDIETETAVFISPGQHDNNITMHGPLNRIVIAKSLVENLIQQQSHSVDNGGELKINIDRLSPYLNVQSSHMSGPEGLPKTQSFTKSNLDLGQCSFNHSSSDCDEYFGKYNSEYSQDFDHGGFASQLVQSRLQMSSPVDDSSSESSDDEDIVLEIQKDPDYQSKIQFAVKLGYHEADLIRALKKLGLDASQNELLSELIKHGISEGETESSDKQAFVDKSSHQVSADLPEIVNDPDDKDLEGADNLRHIIIDGSNIAMSHGNKETFSCQGIKLAVDWFRDRGHKDITVFVPQWRKETSRSDSRIKDQVILSQLEKEKVLVYTPARRIGGKRVVCYDDRYILKLAVETDGIVVSNDNYRDLLDEKQEFKKVIEERLLMYSFVNDRFMPPDDPLGRNGPTLEDFLQKEVSLPKSLPPLCPYGSKKCTYGNKCKFYHPERRNTPQKSVTEKLAEQAQQRMVEVKERNNTKNPLSRTSLCRTKSLNPGEIGKESEKSRLTATLSGSATSLNMQGDDSYQLFNQKLSENLRKMAKEKDSRETQPKTPEKKVKKKSKDTVSQSSPRWNFPSGGISPSGVSPRGTSPVSNLSVPGQDLEFDDSEKFLSGHLLLAKKLSDEANESDKHRKAGKQLKESSLVTGQGAGLSYHFSEIPSAPTMEPKKTKQKVHQPLQKQALSRQLSLQGTEDPRLRHGALKPQYSYGGTSQQLVNNMPSDVKSLMSDFMKGQNQNVVEKQNTYGNVEQSNTQHPSGIKQHRSKPALARMPSEGFTPSHVHEFPFNISMTSHVPVTRMQSAPDPHALQHQHGRSQPRMTRQNSSSDTQLNKLDILDESSALMSGRYFYPDPFAEPVYTRGTLSGTSSSGQLAYQFGGQHTGVTHGRSMGTNNQNLQQFTQNVQPFTNTPNIQQFPNQPNIQPFISSRDVYGYPGNPQLNQQVYEGQHQQMPYRNIPSGSYGLPVQPGMGPPYPRMAMNQPVYGPPPSSTGHTGQHGQTNIVSQGPPTSHGQTNMVGHGPHSHGQAGMVNQAPPTSHGQANMVGHGPHSHGQAGMVSQAPPTSHGQHGGPGFGPGPPHFLDQQTSRIWGSGGTFMPMGGGFPGSDASDQSNSGQMPSQSLTFQHQMRSSPVPSDTDNISQSDPRYELFCNLCKLFPEDKVRTVMRLHPELDNPNEICAYLIGAK